MSGYIKSLILKGGDAELHMLLNKWAMKVHDINNYFIKIIGQPYSVLRIYYDGRLDEKPEHKNSSEQ